MRFISEKVSHHPLVMAYHAEGPGWELTATSSGKTKFWGKSLEIIPTGTSSAKIGDDVYTWCVSALMILLTLELIRSIGENLRHSCVTS